MESHISTELLRKVGLQIPMKHFLLSNRQNVLKNVKINQNLMICGMSKRLMVNFRDHRSIHIQVMQHAVSCTMCGTARRLSLTKTLIHSYWIHFLFYEHTH
jgi:hypothetical protein|uniref:Uncharacterized protein n=1 Tax=Mus musculus TaxID=10090 RepID=Q3U073_MOUSE|nr:unnamed protein product [Mus musculus]